MDISKVKKTETYYLKKDFVLSSGDGWQALLDAGTQINFYRKYNEISGQTNKEFYVFNVFNAFLRFQVESSKLNECITDYVTEISRRGNEQNIRVK